MKTEKYHATICLIVLCIFALVEGTQVGCVPQISGKPVVSIGSPPHGAQVIVGQDVLVQANAMDAMGVTRIELWVDGILLTMSQSPSSSNTYAAVLHWTPTTTGSHMLMVKAVNVSSITSDPVAVTVNVVAQTAPTLPPALPTSAPAMPPTLTPVTPLINTPVTPPNTPIPTPINTPNPTLTNTPTAPALPVGCPGAPVIVSFTASPSTITAGQSATLNWGKVDNATSAVIDHGIGGVATPGNVTVQPATTTTYTLTATGCGGTVTKQVTVTVNPSNVAFPTVEMVGTLIPIGPLFITDLAITDMRLVSTTGPSRLHVGVKNTGNVDYNGSFTYKCVVPQVMLRGTNQVVASLGDEGTITRNIPKGGTDLFNPLGSMTFDATLYWYPQVICVVGLNGDPTPGDNQLTITIP